MDCRNAEDRGTSILFSGFGLPDTGCGDRGLRTKADGDPGLATFVPRDTRGGVTGKLRSKISDSSWIPLPLDKLSSPR